MLEGEEALRYRGIEGILFLPGCAPGFLSEGVLLLDIIFARLGSRLAGVEKFV